MLDFDYISQLWKKENHRRTVCFLEGIFFLPGIYLWFCPCVYVQYVAISLQSVPNMKLHARYECKTLEFRIFDCTLMIPVVMHQLPSKLVAIPGYPLLLPS